MFEKIVGSIRGVLGRSIVVRKRIDCDTCGEKFSASTQRVMNMQSRYVWIPTETTCHDCRFNQTLTEHHIEFNLAMAYVTDRLTQESKTRIDSHCDDCEQCNKILLEAYASEEVTFE